MVTKLGLVDDHVSQSFCVNNLIRKFSIISLGFHFLYQVLASKIYTEKFDKQKAKEKSETNRCEKIQ